MRYASVCDGIGAAHVAWQPLGWQCQWTSEIEPFPAAVVEHHYGFRNLGDMTAITEEMLDAPVDLLVGGTPCQSFSVAGLRGGLADPRGNLALRFVQLAAVMQPRWLVWENVPGVLSSGKGRDFGTFLGALGELGYGFAYRVLDAQWFGVAQRRRRVFVVGHLGDWRRAAAVLFERESVFGNPPTRGATGQGSAVAASIRTKTGRSDDRGDGCDNLIAGSQQIVDFQNYSITGDQCGTLQSAAMAKQNTGFGVMQTPVVSFDWQKGNDKTNSRPSTMNVAVDQSQTIGSTRVPAVAFNGYARGVSETAWPVMASDHKKVEIGVLQPAKIVPFTKSKRAQSTTDDETWVPGEVSPTMSCFDQGDTRATTVVAVQDCSGREKRQNGKGWNGDGTSYTVDAAATQGVAYAIDGGNQAASEEIHHSLRTGRDSGDAVAFKPSHYTRGKDGAPSEVTAPLSADADKGDQDTVVAFAQNQLGEVRTNAQVMGTVNTNQNASGRNTPMVQQAMAVRRLTPRECERLQGFPDDYTLVTYRGKPAADGPRYRALGNSMAVPVMRWIGERIAKVDSLAEGAVA